MDPNSPVFGTVKRLVIALLGVGVIALNKRFGLNLGTEEVVAISGVIAAYLVQSGVVESAKEKSRAEAAKIQTAEAAAAYLRGDTDRAKGLELKVQEHLRGTRQGAP